MSILFCGHVVFVIFCIQVDFFTVYFWKEMSSLYLVDISGKRYSSGSVEMSIVTCKHVLCGDSAYKQNSTFANFTLKNILLDMLLFISLNFEPNFHLANLDFRCK